MCPDPGHHHREGVHPVVCVRLQAAAAGRVVHQVAVPDHQVVQAEAVVDPEEDKIIKKE